jgi:hypothetical protein
MPVIEGHFSSWLKRDKMICEMPGLLAYSLHPSYKGTLLSNKQKQEVRTFIFNMGRGENLLNQFEAFLKGLKISKIK